MNPQGTARTRNAVLRALSIALACVAVFALLVARTAYWEGGDKAHLQSPADIIAGIAVLLILLTYVFREKLDA
jgi:hypothetical protein